MEQTSAIPKSAVIQKTVIQKTVIQKTVQTAVPMRLDRWLAENIDSLSRNRVQQLIEQGAVRLNEALCDRKKELVNAGDRIEIALPEAKPYEVKPEAIALDILYEDDQLLIVNKPAGMVVHPAPGHDRGTLVHALLAHCGDQLTGVGGVQRPGIVHRLDKNTTGAIVVAKTAQALHSLQGQIQSKTAQREYLGIVLGAPKAEQGTVDRPIGRHPKHRKKMAIVPVEQGGRVAITHWKTLERLGNYTLMQFQLETGRTHQIRVHSADLGHPIVGDAEYGSVNRLASSLHLPGQALHAFRLTLTHPVTQATIVGEAPLPEHFSKLLLKLRAV
jgi:23S rRNA pseudouridine1911/1915/1917 synthase